MSKQEQIMKLLERGKIIRLMDGRCGDSFVDMPALTALIQQKRVKVYDNKGVDFVRAYTCEELLALEAAKVAALRLENETMYACILEAAELSGTGAARCKVELQRIAREDAKK